MCFQRRSSSRTSMQSAQKKDRGAGEGRSAAFRARAAPTPTKRTTAESIPNRGSFGIAGRQPPPIRATPAWMRKSIVQISAAAVAATRPYGAQTGGATVAPAPAPSASCGHAACIATLLTLDSATKRPPRCAASPPPPAPRAALLASPPMPSAAWTAEFTPVDPPPPPPPLPPPPLRSSPPPPTAPLPALPPSFPKAPPRPSPPRPSLGLPPEESAPPLCGEAAESSAWPSWRILTPVSGCHMSSTPSHEITFLIKYI